MVKVRQSLASHTQRCSSRQKEICLHRNACSYHVALWHQCIQMHLKAFEIVRIWTLQIAKGEVGNKFERRLFGSHRFSIGCRKWCEMDEQ